MRNIPPLRRAQRATSPQGRGYKLRKKICFFTIPQATSRQPPLHKGALKYDEKEKTSPSVLCEDGSLDRGSLEKGIRVRFFAALRMTILLDLIML